MPKFKKGDLAYIPSHVTMRKYLKEKDNSTRLTPVSVLITQHPANLLVMEETDKHGQIGVHYLGELWFLDSKSAYVSGEVR